MSECLVYQLKPGVTLVGSLDSPTAQIKLSGLNIIEQHCNFVNSDGEVKVEVLPGAQVFVSPRRGTSSAMAFCSWCGTS